MRIKPFSGRVLRYLITSLAAVIIIASGSSIFSQNQYHLLMGGGLDDFAKNAVSTPDNGLMIIGRTYSFGSGDQDIIISRTDSMGYLIWSKVISTTYRDVGYFIKEDHNGGFIATCWINNSPPSYDNWMIIKFDLDGNISHEKFFGGGADDEVHNFCLTADGGYLFTGGTRSFSLTEADLWFIKTDADLNVLWSKAFDAGNAEHSRSVQQTENGNYIILGDSYQGQQNLFLLYLDPAGDLIWSKQFGASGIDYGWSVIISEDDNFIVCGYTENYGAIGLDVLAFKISPAGNIIWSKIYGGSGEEKAFDIESNHPGRYMISATTTSFGLGMEDFLIMEIDENGNAIKAHNYGGSGEEFQPFLDPSIDGGYIISGGTNSYGQGGADVYIIKTNAEGESCCKQEVVDLRETAINLTVNNLYLTEHIEIGVSSHSINYQHIVPETKLICFDSIFLSGDKILCAEFDTGRYTIRPVPNMELEWTVPGGSTIVGYQGDSSISVKFGSQAGNVSVKAEDACSNEDMASIWVDINPTEPPDLGPDTLICSGDPIDLDAGEAYNSYLWQDGSTEQGFLNANSGTYYVEVVDQFGCPSSDTINIKTVDIPHIFLGNDTNIMGEFTLILDAGTGFDDYLWQDGSSYQTYTTSSPGLYWVEAGKEGCADADSIMISNDYPGSIWFPNCFTPNGDHYNDIFLPVYENITLYNILIYNRWGQMVYESDVIGEGWDGTFKGKKLPTGVYYFIASFNEGNEKERKTLTGSVTILK